MTTIPMILQITTAAILVMVPLVILAIAAIGFGVDSRPGIDDRGPHRWTPGG